MVNDTDNSCNSRQSYWANLRLYRRFSGEEAALKRLFSSYLRERQDLNILDIGCGTGAVSRELGSLAEIVVGIDLERPSPEFDEMSSRCRRVVGNALKLPFSDGFSLVTMVFLLDGLSVYGVGRVIEEVRRIQQCGSEVLIVTQDSNSALSRLTERLRRCYLGKEKFFSQTVEGKLAENGVRYSVLRCEEFTWVGMSEDELLKGLRFFWNSKGPIETQWEAALREVIHEFVGRNMQLVGRLIMLRI